MFIVTVNNSGLVFFLRGTVWAYTVERATVHASRAEAEAALAKARKFMKAAIYKRAQIAEVAAA